MSQMKYNYKHRNHSNTLKSQYTIKDYEKVVMNPELALKGCVKPEDIVETELIELHGPIEIICGNPTTGKRRMFTIIKDNK